MQITLNFRLFSVLPRVRAQTVTNTLPVPKALSISVDDALSDLPTHMFAVYSQKSNVVGPRRVTLFPIHDIVFSSQCANLTKLPTAAKVGVSANIVEPGLTAIPVVPLAIPSPQTLPQLAAYLYTHSTLDLLAFLLPIRAAWAHPLYNMSDAMAEAYNIQAVLAHAMTVNGVWGNACALGVFDLGLWNALDVAWEEIITLLAKTTDNRMTLSA